MISKRHTVIYVTIKGSILDLGELAAPDLDLDEFCGQLGEGVALELVNVRHGEPDLGGVGLGGVLEVGGEVGRLDAHPDRVVARLSQGLGVLLGLRGVLAVAEALGSEDQGGREAEGADGSHHADVLSCCH